MKTADVLSAYADHWTIENTFKNTKQHLGVEQLQTWARQLTGLLKLLYPTLHCRLAVVCGLRL